jgi:hypothetical protein
MLATPAAVLLEFQLARGGLLIFRRHVIAALAIATLQLNVVTHRRATP